MGKGGQDEGKRRDGSDSSGSEPATPTFPAWVRTPSECLAELGVSADRGLSAEEAAARLRRYGPNELERHAAPSVWKLVLEQFDDTLVRILLAAAVVSFVLALYDGVEGGEGGEVGATAFVEPLVIFLIMIINAVVGVWQESNAEKALEALKEIQCARGSPEASREFRAVMNFFAGLLLLLMPEENAFWTLVGIIDDYFDGYFSEEMIELHVDQLVLEELVREKFPKLANHLDYLGLQVAWVTGPWFLSIFTNVLPWESVLRVCDVLLFDGNRVMLFRTALALLEFYGPTLVTTKDAGDAVTLLQSLAGSTFDSSQLVLIARMGYQSVNETRLQELRNKHRPSVISSMEERVKGLGVCTDTNSLASKLYNFKRDPEPLVSISNSADQMSDVADGDVNQESDSGNMDDTYGGLTVNSEIDSLPDPMDQVTCLKFELCRLLEERRSAVLRHPKSGILSPRAVTFTSAVMPKAWPETYIKFYTPLIVEEQGSLDSSKAESFVKNLQTEGRYLRDVW